MTHRRYLATILLANAALVLSACSDRSTSPLLTSQGSAENGSTADKYTQPQDVARALAAGLSEQSVRMRVRNAMRQSVHLEHKLLLQEFIETADGSFLLSAASAASGIPVADLRAGIAALPLMDFYVPVVEHRLAWRGDADVVLGLNMDVDDYTLTAYTPAGEIVRLDARDGVPAQTVLILHPAEPRMPGASRRSGPGETIQDPDEPITATEDCILPSGSGEFQTSCTGEGDGSVVSYKYLRKFIAYVDDGWGSAEVKFFMWQVNADGTRTKLWDWRMDGVEPGVLYTPNMAFSKMGTYAHVEEMDSWLTGSDDYWGDSYATWTHAYNDQRGFAPSTDWTLIIGACGPVYQDVNWRAICGSDGSSDGDFYAWHKLIHTVDVVYEY